MEQKEVKRNIRRSIVSDADTLKQADKILATQGSSISQFCHTQLVALIETAKSMKGFKKSK